MENTTICESHSTRLEIGSDRIGLDRTGLLIYVAYREGVGTDVRSFGKKGDRDECMSGVRCEEVMGVR